MFCGSDFPSGSGVENLPAVQETWVRSLGQQDPLEREMATHSSILAWRTPWTKEPDGLQSMGSQRVELTSATKQQLQHKLGNTEAGCWLLIAQQDRGKDSDIQCQVNGRMQ